MRPPRWIPVASAMVYVALGVMWTIQAPCGSWQNRLLGFDMWAENDPGGWYIPAAHQVFSARREPSYVGHPGVPLVLLLHFEQLALYTLGRGAGTPLAFTPFIAQHVRTVWTVAKTSIVLLHLLSFLCLFHYSLLVTRRRDLAWCATAVYATSFPVLYYLNRVSVEPMVVGFFLLTMVFLVRAEEARDAGWGREMWAAAAGLCAVSAFFSKLQLMALWPAIAAAAVFLGLGGPRLSVWRRARMTAAYASAGLLLGLLYSSLVNWQEFARYWQQAGRIDAAASATPSAVGFVWAVVRNVLVTVCDTVGKIELQALLPAPTRSGCFFLFEFLTGLSFLAGLWRFLYTGGLRRGLVAWTFVQSATVGAAWFYRAGRMDFHGFHYLFPALAALAPLTALGVEGIVLALHDGLKVPRPALVAVAIVVFHAGGFAAVCGSKWQDAEAFRQSRATYYLAALERAAPGEIVAVIGSPRIPFHGLEESPMSPDGQSTLLRELDRIDRRRFIWRTQLADPGAPGGWARWAERRGVGLVIDFALESPGPLSVSAWLERRARIRPLEPSR
jgi:hypothetical protein